MTNVWLCILLLLTLCCIICEFRSTSKRLRAYDFIKLTKIVKNEDAHVTNQLCENLPSTELTDVLGAAYNSRYMSIEEPNYFEESEENINQQTNSIKRNSEPFQPFYVDDLYASEISDKPAWEVKHATNLILGESMESINQQQNNNSTLHTRVKRDRRGSRNERPYDRPWECEGKIKWFDLGPDYFPRFLRNVECTKQQCWYGHYTCKSRSFTVKILRRRNGECVESKRNKVSNDELPVELKQLWVWEERAVNFCCDCARA